jgi:hypothetical protein
MAALFSSRASVDVIGGGILCRASWPFGGVEFDSDSFTFSAGWKSFRISFSDVDRVEVGWQSALFVHHAVDVPSLVRVRGRSVSQEIREAIEFHGLKVKVLT